LLGEFHGVTLVLDVKEVEAEVARVVRSMARWWPWRAAGWGMAALDIGRRGKWVRGWRGREKHLREGGGEWLTRDGELTTTGTFHGSGGEGPKSSQLVGFPGTRSCGEQEGA
jgi:hypothetical protein